MIKYRENIEKLIKNIWYIIPVILTALLSFGFVVTHTSISVDTLSADRYFDGEELIRQGRFTAVLIDKIFSVMEFNPFFVDMLAVIFLIIASILFSALFMNITGNKLKNIVYTIFSCIFISYPLINEIFVYTPAGLSIAIGYSLISVSLILMYEVIKNNKKTNIIFSTLLVCLAISLYESFAAVYLCGIIMILILNYMFTETDKEKTFKQNLKYAVIMLIVVICAVVLNSLIGNLLKHVMNIEGNGNAAKYITYSQQGIIGGIKTLLVTSFANYILAAFYYVPLTTLMIAIVILCGLIIKNIFNKRILLALMFCALLIATFSLTIVQGIASPYRTCQTFAFVTAFVIMIFIQLMLESNTKTWLKNILLVLTFILIFYQAKDLHKWFYLNNLRYEQEKNIVIAIGNKLEAEYDLNKPVIFSGNVSVPSIIRQETYLSSDSVSAKVIKNICNIINFNMYDFSGKYILKYPETNVNSYLSWAIYAFPLDDAANPELIKIFNYFGYDIKGADKKLYENAIEDNNDMERWPNENSIIETNEYILVNF